jgi:hypothetical protein
MGYGELCMKSMPKTCIDICILSFFLSQMTLYQSEPDTVGIDWARGLGM